MRRAAKRDDNEPVIVTALQSAGWTVVRVSDSGAPDLLVARFGVLTLMEVKGPKGTLTDTQTVAFTKLATAGVLVQVVRSPFDALTAVGAPLSKTATAGPFWLAENGAFLCESCWLPENGLHAKDCPTRKALKVPPKVQSAYRAAKKMEEAMPKKHQERLDEAGAVDLRDNLRLEHLGGGYSRAVPIDPKKRHGHTMIATPTSPMSEVAFSDPSRGVEGELQPRNPGKHAKEKRADRFDDYWQAGR